jgi:hypothetical protein
MRNRAGVEPAQGLRAASEFHVPARVKMRAGPLMLLALGCALLSGACSPTHFQDGPRPAIGPVPQKCTLTQAAAPALRGFRLGMSYAEVQKRFPGLSKPATTVDGGSAVVISIQGDQLTRKKYPDLKEIDSVELRLSDDRVTSYRITYPEIKDFDSAAGFQFLHEDDKALEEVKGYAEEDPDRNYGRKIACGGFIVRADIGKRDIKLTGGAEGRTYHPWVEVEDIATSNR